MKGETKSEFAKGWPVVLASGLGIGLGMSPVPFYTIGVLAPELTHAFGWGQGQVMTGVLISSFGTIAISPIVGLLSDRFGVRIVALMGVLIFGLCFMGFALSNGSLPLYYLNWAILSAFGVATLPITWTRAVNNWFDKSKGVALGLALCGTGVFGILGPQYTHWLIQHYGWRGAYVGIGFLPLLIALPVAILFFRDVGPQNETGAERKASLEARRSLMPGSSAGQAFRDWRLWVLVFAFFPISFTVGGVIGNLVKILEVTGFSPGQAVSLLSIIGLAVIIGRISGGWLIDRIWAPAIAVVLVGMPASACLILAHGQLSIQITAIGVFMFGFASGVEYDLMAFLVARYFGMKSYGAIYGSLYAAFALGAGVGPTVFGRIYDATRSFNAPLTVASVVMFGGACLLLTLGKYRYAARSKAEDILVEAELTGESRPV